MGMSRLEISVDLDDAIKTATSSKGNQSKWFKDDYWIKENSLGYEDIAEWAVSNVLKCSDLSYDEYVLYKLCNIINNRNMVTKGCMSKNFLEQGYTLITLYRLFQIFNLDFSIITGKENSTDYKIKYTIEAIYMNTNVDITDYLRKLITLDAFVLNEDRHFNNMAFLIKFSEDSENGFSDYRVSPIFDNGLSLLSDVQAYPYSTPLDVNIRRVKSHSFSSSYSKQLDVLGLGFQIDGSKLENFLESNKEELGRAYDVLKFQSNKYRGSIVV